MKTVKITLLTSLFLFIFGSSINAQVGINTDGSAPDNSAILDLKSTTKGLLLPRMTTEQQQSIANPTAGLVVFNTDSSNVYFFNGSHWIGMGGNCDTIWNCGANITYEEQSYATVQIGTQCWMAENLNIGTRIDGVNNQTDNCTIEKYCYNDDNANCNTYGGLYQWDEMMQYTIQQGTQGICPNGWHLPTDEEWKVLEGTVDSQYPVGDPEWDDTSYRGYDAGKNLKSTSGWYNNGNGVNSSGFTGLPGGWRDNGTGSFYALTVYGYLWSSSEVSSTHAWFRILHYGHDQVGRDGSNKTIGRSIRCLKD